MSSGTAQAMPHPVSLDQLRPMSELDARLRAAAYPTQALADTDGYRLEWSGHGLAPSGDGLLVNYGDHACWLGLSDWSVLDPLLETGTDSLPVEALLALQEDAATPVLRMLGPSLGGPLTCVGVMPAAVFQEQHAAATGTLGFRLSGAGLAGVVPGCLIGDAALLASTARWSRRDTDLTVCAQVPVVLPVSLGQARLSFAMLERLQEGDVLRLDGLTGTDLAMSVVMSLPGANAMAMRARLKGCELIVESFVNNVEPSDHMPETLERLEDMPCTVRAELGQVVLSMGELAALRPGNVLRLASRADAMTVNLTVHGREIGKGELVAIGDEWAVMISSLSTSATTRP